MLNFLFVFFYFPFSFWVKIVVVFFFIVFFIIISVLIWIILVHQAKLNENVALGTSCNEISFLYFILVNVYFITSNKMNFYAFSFS